MMRNCLISILMISPFVMTILGCHTDNPGSCTISSGQQCSLNDAGPTVCDQQCVGATPVCDLGTGGSMACVECTVDEHTLCTGATPACIDNKCAQCTAHAQCDASNVCLPDGSCADA